VGSILLDGKKLDDSFEVPSLLELVAEIEEKHINKGWIVVEVSVDGNKLTDFTHPDGTLLPYDPESDVTIITRELKEIILTSIDEFEKYLSRLIPGLTEIAKLIKDGKPEEANVLYVEAIDGIRVMIELVQGMSATNTINYEAPRQDGKSLMQMTDDLKVIIQMLVEAQTNKDDERIAQLLKNELSRELTVWQEIMPSLRSEVEG
jgi:hypothetical protein